MAAMRWTSALIALSVVLSSALPICARDRLLMAWSAASNLIAVGIRDQVRLYDGNTQQLVAVLEGKGAPLMALAWQPEGDLLATGDANGWLCLWSAAAFTSECRLFADFVIRVLAWHPSGDLLVGASGDQVRFWRVPSLALSRAWSAEGIVTALAWQAESLAVGGALRGTYEQGFLTLYSSLGEVQQRYTAEMRPPLSLQSLSADRLGVSAPFDVFVWQRATQQSVPLYLLAGGRGGAPCRLERRRRARAHRPERTGALLCRRQAGRRDRPRCASGGADMARRRALRSAPDRGGRLALR